MAKRGRPTDRVKDINASVRLPAEDYDQFRQLAQKRGKSFSELIRDLLRGAEDETPRQAN